MKYVEKCLETPNQNCSISSRIAVITSSLYTVNICIFVNAGALLENLKRHIITRSRATSVHPADLLDKVTQELKEFLPTAKRVKPCPDGTAVNPAITFCNLTTKTTNKKHQQITLERGAPPVRPQLLFLTNECFLAQCTDRILITM